MMRLQLAPELVIATSAWGLSMYLAALWVLEVRKLSLNNSELPHIASGLNCQSSPNLQRWHLNLLPPILLLSIAVSWLLGSLSCWAGMLASFMDHSVLDWTLVIGVAVFSTPFLATASAAVVTATAIATAATTATDAAALVVANCNGIGIVCIILYI